MPGTSALTLGVQSATLISLVFSLAFVLLHKTRKGNIPSPSTLIKFLASVTSLSYAIIAIINILFDRFPNIDDESLSVFAISLLLSIYFLFHELGKMVSPLVKMPSHRPGQPSGKANHPPIPEEGENDATGQSST